MGEGDRPGAGDDREEREATPRPGQPRAHGARVEAGRPRQRSRATLRLLPYYGRVHGGDIMRLATIRRQDRHGSQLSVRVNVCVCVCVCGCRLDVGER